MKKEKFYNVLFPIWMLVFLPTPLWFFLIPANYLIDYLVLRHCKKKLGIEEEKFLLKYTWLVCLFGFISDFLGALFLFVCLNVITGPEYHDVIQAISMNPFHDIRGFLLIVVGIAIAAFFIYLCNYLFFIKGYEKEKAKYIALRMALFTAPYLFLIPLYW